MILVKIKSNEPIKKATTRETAITIKVRRMVCWYESQVTLLNSLLTSFKKDGTRPKLTDVAIVDKFYHML